jgi:hypothetical protein
MARTNRSQLCVVCQFPGAQLHRCVLEPRSPSPFDLSSQVCCGGYNFVRAVFALAENAILPRMDDWRDCTPHKSTSPVALTLPRQVHAASTLLVLRRHRLIETTGFSPGCRVKLPRGALISRTSPSLTRLHRNELPIPLNSLFTLMRK